MSDNGYEAVLLAIEKLCPADRLRLVAEITGKIGHGTETPRQHSILELRGLGKEVWAGLDPDKYVEQERTSWNG